jgi:hypothetical protein
VQIRRYAGGTSQPTLDIIHRLAIALGVSADMLVFDQAERGRPDTTLLIRNGVPMSKHEQEMVCELRDAVIIKNQGPTRWKALKKQAITERRRAQSKI